MSEIWVDFKGRRYTTPFLCFCCGKAIDVQQFCFGRSCGQCDTGHCKCSTFLKLHGHKQAIESGEIHPEAIIKDGGVLKP